MQTLSLLSGSGFDWVINGAMFGAGQSEGCTNGATKYIVVPGQRQVKETDKKPLETPKSLKIKKSGGKKKWNKRKFLRKTDQIVDDEKDGAREAGDVHDCDVPMQASRDSIMLHPEEEARIVEQELLRDMTMLQADKEAGSVKQGLPDPMLQHHEEARRVEPADLSRDAAMVQFTKEVVMLQSDEEARIIEPEPPRDPAMAEPKEAARCVEQEPLGSAEVVKPNMEARAVEQESVSTYVALQFDRDQAK